MFSEFDLAVVTAMRVNPRADWARLGAALGTSGATVARHWERLGAERLAWVTVAPGRYFGRHGHSAHVFLSAPPRYHEDVAAQLCDEPAAATVALVTGGHDFRIDCFAATHADLDTIIAESFSSLPGVTRMEAAYVSRVHRQGSEWRGGALDKAQERSVAREQSGSGQSHWRTPDELDTRLIAALSADGRARWRDIGRSCGVSAQTARRRIERHLESGYIDLRCDTAESADEQFREVSLVLNVPATRVSEVGEYFGALPNCRLSAQVLSVHNLVATLWVRDLAVIHDHENALESLAPGATVLSRSVTVKTHKRVGHVVDSAGRSERVVPLSMWAGRP